VRTLERKAPCDRGLRHGGCKHRATACDLRHDNPRGAKAQSHRLAGA